MTDTSQQASKLHQVLGEEFEQIFSGERITFPAQADDEEKLSLIWSRLHDRKPSALCLSGGGIRSATFALGILQGLARSGLLDKFDYLSTVSGGGYIGSWLTAWIHREKDIGAVSGQLTGHPGHARLETVPDAGAPEAAGPEPTPILRLRQYSNYLTPRLGLLSADTWTWVGIYLRNLILNWLVLIPLLAAVLTIPKMGVPLVRLENVGLRWAFLWAGLALLTWAVAYIGANLPSARTTGASGLLTRWLRRHSDQSGFLWGCWAPLLISATALTTFWAWHLNAGATQPHWGIFAAIGSALHCMGWLPYVVHQRSRPSKVARQLSAVAVAGAVGGLLAWWLTGFIPRIDGSPQLARLYVCFATPALLTAMLLAKTLFVGLFSRFSDDDDREWWARAGGWLLIAIVIWSITSALVLFGPDLMAEARGWITGVGGVSGLITILLGHSAQTPANLKEKAQLTGRFGSGIRYKNLLLKSAAPLFAAFLIALLSLATDSAADLLVSRASSLTSANEVLFADFQRIAGIALALAALGVVMACFINVNKFSLHAAYRNRLIRAYLGASRRQRHPNPFTGLDSGDNIQMHELKGQKPFHVINMALNLVKGNNLAWQQRKAESFTVTPLHAGSSRMNGALGCYRPSAGYGKGDKGESITLGTAVAISGAAASPNMGYHSSPGITFLLTLFNARLGWWLGNPGRNTYNRAYPRFAIGPLLAETFGFTNDQSDYIYLSDGGHFENLGLYEMVLRRCHFIVISDAGQDAECTFEDLGNAIRKIRVDLGIPIEMREVCIYPRSRKEQGKCCGIGRIKYACMDGDGVDDGYLLYVKPAFYGNEPMDIYQYAQSSEAFPHEPTFDQWFSESQFESYRMLGFNTIRTLAEQVFGSGEPIPPWPTLTLDELWQRAERYLQPNDT